MIVLLKILYNDKNHVLCFFSTYEQQQNMIHISYNVIIKLNFCQNVVSTSNSLA